MILGGVDGDRVDARREAQRLVLRHQSGGSRVKHEKPDAALGVARELVGQPVVIDRAHELLSAALSDAGDLCDRDGKRVHRNAHRLRVEVTT